VLSNARARLRDRVRRARSLPDDTVDLAGHRLPAADADRLLGEAGSDLERIVYGHRGRPVQKWTHYLPVYDEHLARYRGTGARLLEIGVSRGGSLEVWRRYLGPAATVFGIDVNPACAERVDPPNQVRIGSQADPEFLRSVVREMGGLDVVIDDGSHVASHQLATFRTLFPLLAEDGVFVVEDLHTAYMPRFEGGYRRRGTAIELARTLMDDMHAWYHDAGEREVPRDAVTGLHLHDSIMVVTKGRKESPAQIVVGEGADSI
jgi:cephalosporin hydroxylase